MGKIRNIVFSVIAAAVLFSVIGAQVLDATNVLEMPKKSFLEGHSYQEFPEVKAKAIAKGSFQKQFESYMADHVPVRDQVILANAALQRQGIRTANVVMGYDVFHTLYGGRYVTVRDGAATLGPAAKATSVGKKNLKAMLKTLNQAAKENPNVNIVVDTVLSPIQVEVTPTAELINADKVNANWVYSNINEKLDPSITAFVDGADSQEELDTVWMSTESHWTLERSLVAYNKIAKRLGLEHAEYKDPVLISNEWYGNYARVGLCLDARSQLYDMPTDYSNLSVYNLGKVEKGKEIQKGLREKILAGETTLNADSKYNGYTEYYGSNNKEVINHGKNNGKTCLVIGDSFTHSLWRVISNNYAHTAFILPGNVEMDKSFQEYIDQYKPDDIIWMMNATKCKKIASYSPKFIGIENADKSGGEDDDS